MTGFINTNGNYLINASNVSSSGNVIAPYFIGDGSQLTGITTSGNAIASGSSNVSIPTGGGNVTVSVAGTSNVVVYTSTGELVAGTVSASGDITTAGYFVGDGSQLTGITASGAKIANGSSNVDIVSNASNVTVGVAGIANVVTFATTGAYIAGRLSASGNVTGDYILGNGAFLTGITGGGGGGSYIANGTSNVSIPVSNGNATVSVNGISNIIVAYSGGVDMIGTAYASGNVIAAGNVSGGYILGNGYYLSGLSAITYGNANVETFLPTYTGNLAGGNANIATTVYTQNIASSNGSNNVGFNSTATFAGNANVAGNVNVTGTVNGNLVGTTTGTHNGLVYSIDIRYLSWDFGTFTGTYFNPIQYLLAQAGGIDMGTFLAPSSTSIDIGPITSTP